MQCVHRYWWDLPQAERDAQLHLQHNSPATVEDVAEISIGAELLLLLFIGRANGGMSVVAEITFAILSHSRRNAGKRATNCLDDIKVPHTLIHSHTHTRSI